MPPGHHLLAADQRGEGMTEQPQRPAPHGKAPALMRATSTHRLSRKNPNHSTLDNPNRMRRTATAPRPYRPLRGRAPPEPGPRHLISAPNQRVEGKKKGQPTLLTGPAPSGMTCTDVPPLPRAARWLLTAFAGFRANTWGILATHLRHQGGAASRGPETTRLLTVLHLLGRVLGKALSAMCRRRRLSRAARRSLCLSGVGRGRHRLRPRWWCNSRPGS